MSMPSSSNAFITRPSAGSGQSVDERVSATRAQRSWSFTATFNS